jgi:TonB family protein
VNDLLIEDSETARRIDDFSPNLRGTNSNVRQKMKTAIQKIIVLLALFEVGCISSEKTYSRDPVENAFSYANHANAELSASDSEFKSHVKTANPKDGHESNTIGPWLTTKTPRILFSYPPEFPKFATNSNTDVKVLVSITVTINGDVTNAVVEKTSDERFNSYALTAVRKWKFMPAIAQGKPVEFQIKVPVQFKNS